MSDRAPPQKCKAASLQESASQSKPAGKAKLTTPPVSKPTVKQPLQVGRKPSPDETRREQSPDEDREQTSNVTDRQPARTKHERSDQVGKTASNLRPGSGTGREQPRRSFSHMNVSTNPSEKSSVVQSGTLHKASLNGSKLLEISRERPLKSRNGHKGGQSMVTGGEQTRQSGSGERSTAQAGSGKSLSHTEQTSKTGRKRSSGQVASGKDPLSRSDRSQQTAGASRTSLNSRSRQTARTEKRAVVFGTSLLERGVIAPILHRNYYRVIFADFEPSRITSLGNAQPPVYRVVGHQLEGPAATAVVNN
jgi:hypothetical protein